MKKLNAFASFTLPMGGDDDWEENIGFTIYVENETEKELSKKMVPHLLKHGKFDVRSLWVDIDGPESHIDIESLSKLVREELEIARNDKTAQEEREEFALYQKLKEKYEGK